MKFEEKKSFDLHFKLTWRNIKDLNHGFKTTSE